MNMRVLASVTLSLSLVASSLFAAGLDDIKNKGVLSVSLYKDFPPYSYVADGKQTGIDVDIANALAAKLGVSSQIRLVGADENVEDDLRNNVWKGHYLGGGVTDLMLHMPVDNAFAEKVDKVKFIAPYQLEQVAFAFDTNKVGKQPTLANFMSDSIGVEIDTLSDVYLLEAMQGQISKNIRHFENLSKATTALKAGEIAGVMGPRGELEGLLAEHPDTIQIQSLVTPGLARSNWAMGIAVKADNEELVKAINESMAALVKDGTVKKIFEQYKVTYTPPAIAPEVTAKN
ncbi:transporter substrate-binding domain-containing protein [uncultured Thiothrix sp.]|uniref:substrate-binding periplasmic protein n=1 Tax=uncultured Thiothrix sp. TaxID=223185 RepID=UPI00261AA228|nr:transporter substrate-binding domain-containing protein [uncultured Thiothrix sp.]HMT91533.1 transporter substrate-binding domain-containing protein [Thiolinea sp.]